MNTDNTANQNFENFEQIQQSTGEVSAEQAAIAQEWETSMQELNDQDPNSPQNIQNAWENAFNDNYGDDGAAFIGFSPEQPNYTQPQETQPDYTEMPGLDLGTGEGEIANLMQTKAPDETDAPAYAQAFSGSNPVASMAAEKAVNGAQGISTDSIISSLEGNGITKSDISSIVDSHSVDHINAMQAAYSDNNGNEAIDQRDAATITTAITELDMQAKAEAGIAAAAVANGSASANEHKAKAVEAARKAETLADAASFANKFVDNADLNRRFSESITSARQDASQVIQAVESLNEQNAENIAEELGVDEETLQDEVAETSSEEQPAGTSSETAEAEDATTEVSAIDPLVQEALQPTQLNPEILGENSTPAPEITNPSTSTPDTSTPDTATNIAPNSEANLIGEPAPAISTTEATEAALQTNNPLNAAVNQLNAAQNLRIDQFGQRNNTPSADDIKRAMQR